MKNKYFTPEISDICVGYELEIRQANKWLLHKIQSNDCFCDFVDMDGYRVPYLTKEQIEAEGWKQISSEILTHGYFLKGECRLELLEDSIICIRNGYWYPENTIYKGECKDINTFRKIIKLLEI